MIRVNYARIEAGWQKATISAGEGVTHLFDLVRSMDDGRQWQIEAASQPHGRAEAAYALLEHGAIRGGFPTLKEAKRALEAVANESWLHAST